MATPGILADDDSKSLSLVSFLLFNLITATAVTGDSLDSDSQVLLSFKAYLESLNPTERGKYNEWETEKKQEVCQWPGITCTPEASRVTGINLRDSTISGPLFRNFSALTQLTFLDLSSNTIGGSFEVNWRERDYIVAGSGECLVMKRWIPAEFPPFLFGLETLAKRSCRSLWDHVREGKCIFPVCPPGSVVGPLDVSGYLQLSGNKMSGEVPANISKMKKLSMLHLGFNEFEGRLPREIGELPLVFLNLTRNKFSGQIPREIGDLYNLQNLDLSHNNFSGNFPTSLNDLNEMSKFNISYNPLIYGVIPSRGQLATFGKESFLGNPLLQLPSFFNQSGNNNSSSGERDSGREEEEDDDDESAIDMLAFCWSTVSFYVVALMGTLVLVYFDCPWCRPWLGLVDAFMAFLKRMLFSNRYSSVIKGKA